MKMIKYLFVPIFLFSSLFAIDIEEVEDKSINENKASYVKDGRLILNPIKNPILNVMSKNDFKKIGKSLKKKDSKRKVNDKITNSKPKENDKITNLKPKENDKITNLKPKEKIVYKEKIEYKEKVVYKDRVVKKEVKINKKPTLILEASVLSGVIPLKVDFTIIASDDKAIVSHYISLDGKETIGKGIPSSNILKTFYTAGSYKLFVLVKDEEGLMISKKLTINTREETFDDYKKMYGN